MRPWLRETFTSLRVQQYRALWYGITLNFGALWFSIVARGFLAFELTESTTALGALSLGFGIPMLLLAPVGGAVADRLSRRTLVILGYASFALVNGVQAVLILAGVIDIWMLFAGAVVEGAAVAFTIPSRQALIGDLVEEDELGNAIALSMVSFNAMRVAAPSIAGALIAVAFVGVGGTFALTSVMYVASVVTIMRVRPGEAKPSEGRASPLADIVQGVRYVRGRPAILVLVVIAYALELTAFTYFIFVPAVVSELFDLGSIELGVLTTAIGVGAFGASLVAARIVDGRHAWGVHALSSLVFGLLLMAFALSPVYAVALFVGVWLGATETGFLSLNQSLAMRFCDREYYGRVQAVLMFGFALNGIVALPVGVLADSAGLREALFALGAAGTLLVVAALLFARRVDAQADALTPGERARRADTIAAS